MSIFNNKYKVINVLLVTLALVTASPVASYASGSPAQQRAAVDQMDSQTLARLYKLHPQAKTEIANSVGYAVFSSGSLAVIWVSGGYGHGVAHNFTRHTKTYMNMANAGIGLGLGAKSYNTVFIFRDPKIYNDFITTGLDLTGSADADAKEKSKGGAASGSADVLKGVKIYQLTDTGLLAQLMLQGTKYWPDHDLTSDK
jgi:lipid-binding SYLF domain-containing protein